MHTSQATVPRRTYHGSKGTESRISAQELSDGSKQRKWKRQFMFSGYVK